MPLYDLTVQKVKDTASILEDPADFDAAIAEALNRYSKHRPRLVVDDVPGQDGPDIALPVGWVTDFSAIDSIEFPIGNVPETFIDRTGWRFYKTPTDTFIRFTEARPASDEEARITFTALHTEPTLPPVDVEAVANLAASFCCGQLARHYGQTSDPTIQADSVNYRSKGDEYARRAKELEAQYKNHVGIKESDTTPAAMAVAPAPDDSRVRLTHTRRR